MQQHIGVAPLQALNTSGYGKELDNLPYPHVLARGARGAERISKCLFIGYCTKPAHNERNSVEMAKQ